MKDDFNVHVIYVHADPDLDKTFEFHRTDENGIDEQIVYFKSSKRLFRKIINALRYKKAQRLAYQKIKNKISLCHVHVPYRSAFLAIELKKEGIPFVITEHWSGHLTGEFGKKNSTDKKIYRKVLSKASKIACVSQHLADAFEKNTGFKAEVIPNYIEKADPIEDLPDGRESIRILSVSDLADDVKNVSGLLRAFKSAHDQNPKLRLTIIGGGPDEIKLQKMVSQLELDEQVTMTGRKPNKAVLAEMQQCNFYICNSNFETFGMTVAEALMAGKPVISTKCGGPEEFVKESNGMLIPVKDENALTEAIIKMAETYQQFDSREISGEIERRFGRVAVRKRLLGFYDL